MNRYNNPGIEHDYYLYDDDTKCIKKEEMPVTPLRGFMKFTLIQNRCENKLCHYCLNDNKFCTACTPTRKNKGIYSVYLQAHAGRCFHYHSIPPYYGIDISNPSTIIPCTNTSCLWCRDDSEVCNHFNETNQCNTANCSRCIIIYAGLEICKEFSTNTEDRSFYLDNGRVIEKHDFSLISKSLVSESLPYLFHQCISLICQDCSADLRFCTKCPFGYYLSNGRCLPIPEGYGLVQDT